MDSASSEQIAIEVPHTFTIYKDGRIDRYQGLDTVPPLADPETGVQSKDVTLDPNSGLSARIFLPRLPDPHRKLPLLVYFHGGAFCVHTPFTAQFHRHVGTLAAASGAVAVSVDYRLAPEHPLPAAFDDAWAAVGWVATHVGGDGPEPWINDHADLGRVFVAGDSAGATLAHHAARQAAGGDGDGLGGMKIAGVVAVHPYFQGGEMGEKLLDLIYPTRRSSGCVPAMNPGKDTGLGSLGCNKVLICVAERDFIRDRGLAYYESLKNSGWGGELVLHETEGEQHVFHLFDPSCDKALALVSRVASFLNN